MTCNNQVGVKNIMISFFDCETNTRILAVSHKQATSDLPTIRTCNTKSEALPGGFTKRVQDSPMMELKIIRDLRLPLRFYQGCSGVDVQVEYYNGLLYTGLNGNSTGDDKSDTHEVMMNLTFETIDELLPPGSLAN